jgi:hypothetical protein
MALMDPIATLQAAVLALGIGSYQHYGAFNCQGSFGRFADGHLASMPSQLTFVIDWQIPAIVTDDGTPGRVTNWTPLELAFDVQYPTYKQFRRRLLRHLRAEAAGNQILSRRVTARCVAPESVNLRAALSPVFFPSR